MAERMTGGKAIVRTLIQQGIDTIFGQPGVQLDNTFDALYEARNAIRTIHTRHEQAAGYMARLCAGKRAGRRLYRRSGTRTAQYRGRHRHGGGIECASAVHCGPDPLEPDRRWHGHDPRNS